MRLVASLARRGHRSPGSTGRGSGWRPPRQGHVESHSVIVRRLEAGSVRRLATMVNTVSENDDDFRPRPRDAKCSSRPRREKYEKRRRRHRSSATLARAHGLDIGALGVGARALTIRSSCPGSRSSPTSPRRNSVRWVFFPSHARPRRASDTRSAFATAPDRPLDEHAVILQHCNSCVDVSPLHRAPETAISQRTVLVRGIAALQKRA